MPRRGGPPRSRDEIKALAGRAVLEDLRERSLRQRKKWHLLEQVQLVEVLITIRDGQAHETARTVATLP